jgi:hypothetical protein
MLSKTRSLLDIATMSIVDCEHIHLLVSPELQVLLVSSFSYEDFPALMKSPRMTALFSAI